MLQQHFPKEAPHIMDDINKFEPPSSIEEAQHEIKHLKRALPRHGSFTIGSTTTCLGILGLLSGSIGLALICILIGIIFFILGSYGIGFSVTGTRLDMSNYSQNMEHRIAYLKGYIDSHGGPPHILIQSQKTDFWKRSWVRLKSASPMIGLGTLVVLFIGYVYIENPERKLRLGESVEDATFIEKNFDNLNLHYTTLKEVRFIDTSLNSSTLTRVNASGIVFDRVQMLKSKLEFVTLLKAKINQVDLRNSDMRSTSLAKATLTEVNLTGADLRWSNWCGTDARGAILKDAKLQYAIYDESTQWPKEFDPVKHGLSLIGPKLRLVRQDLSNLNLAGAHLEKSILYGPDLRGTDLELAELSGTMINGPLCDYKTQWNSKHDYRGNCFQKGELIDRDTYKRSEDSLVFDMFDVSSHFPNTSLNKVTDNHIWKLNFNQGELAGIKLHKRKVSYSLFEKAILAHTQIKESQIIESVMDKADLRFSVFSRTRLQRVSLIGADLRYADWHDTEIIASNFKGADLRGLDLSKAQLKDNCWINIKSDQYTRWPEAFQPSQVRNDSCKPLNKDFSNKSIFEKWRKSDSRRGGSSGSSGGGRGKAGIKWVKIRGGSFMMGSKSGVGQDDE